MLLLKTRARVVIAAYITIHSEKNNEINFRQLNCIILSTIMSQSVCGLTVNSHVTRLLKSNVSLRPFFFAIRKGARRVLSLFRYTQDFSSLFLNPGTKKLKVF